MPLIHELPEARIIPSIKEVLESLKPRTRFVYYELWKLTYAKGGASPTIREVSKACGMSSTASHWQIDILVKAGLIKKVTNGYTFAGARWGTNENAGIFMPEEVSNE